MLTLPPEQDSPTEYSICDGSGTAQGKLSVKHPYINPL